MVAFKSILKVILFFQIIILVENIIISIQQRIVFFPNSQVFNKKYNE